MGFAIDRRLQRRRDRIAELLAIDLDEQEWRNDPVDFPDDPDMSREARFMKWRETPPNSGSLVYRIDLAIEEITGELRRCWALSRDVNRAASSAQIYRILERLEADSDRAVELFRSIDPRVRHLIEEAYPGGWMSLEAEGPDVHVLKETISKLRMALPKPDKGRPAGTKDYASEKLASGLADIYERFSGKPAVRRLLVDLSKKTNAHLEYGPFKKFADEILAIVPPKLRRTQKGGLRSSDYFVRMAVESRKN